MEQGQYCDFPNVRKAILKNTLRLGHPTVREIIITVNIETILYIRVQKTFKSWYGIRVFPFKCAFDI